MIIINDKKKCPECGAYSQGNGYCTNGHPIPNNTILEQDECAPDGFEYFDAKMKKLIGINVAEFKKKATIIKDDRNMIRHYNGYSLESYPEEPWLHLFKL